MKLDRCIDRQYAASFAWMCAVYAALMVVLVGAAWLLGPWAAAGFFAFMAWAYRWPIGVKLGWCARRPGARAWDGAPPAPGEGPERGTARGARAAP